MKVWSSQSGVSIPKLAKLGDTGVLSL
jgi:hypothetical protein